MTHKGTVYLETSRLILRRFQKEIRRRFYEMVQSVFWDLQPSCQFIGKAFSTFRQRILTITVVILSVILIRKHTKQRKGEI